MGIDPGRLRLYLVTPPCAASRSGYPAIVEGALRGGVTAVQLRMKGAPVAEFLKLGAPLRALTREAGALFIVNDRLDVALALGADGVHLGSDDLPVDAAKHLAPSLVIGATVRDSGEARRAIVAGASYLGFGAVFPSRTKADSPVGGIEGLRSLVVAAGTVPVVGIGGIDSERLGKVMATGAAGAAVVDSLDSPDAPEAERAAQRFCSGH